MMKIDKGIPLPTPRRNKYPFPQMKVGDSFVTDDRHKTYAAARAYGITHNMSFSCREVDGVCRLWRVK